MGVGTFVEDYCDLVKCNVQFYRYHWKGALAINVAIIGGLAGAYYYQEMQEEKRRKMKKYKHHHDNREVSVDYEVVHE